VWPSTRTPDVRYRDSDPDVECRGRKTAEIDGAIHAEATGPLPPVQFAGARDHRARKVDAVDRLKVIGERACNSSDAAAEIERSLSARAWHDPHQIRNEPQGVGAAGCEERVDVPRDPTDSARYENRAERIATAQRVPVPVEAPQIPSHGR
jgi:hypothetical protein